MWSNVKKSIIVSGRLYYMGRPVKYQSQDHQRWISRNMSFRKHIIVNTSENARGRWEITDV